MTEETTAVPAAIEPPKKNKGGRPKKQILAPVVPPATPPPPKPDNPAVLELQNDIVTLVRARAAASLAVNEAQEHAIIASGRLQAAQGKLAQLDVEVQYRMQVIRQLKGEMASGGSTITMTVPSAGTYTLPPQNAVISSVPTEPNDLVNRAHATRSMI